VSRFDSVNKISTSCETKSYSLKKTPLLDADLAKHINSRNTKYKSGES